MKLEKKIVGILALLILSWGGAMQTFAANPPQSLGYEGFLTTTSGVAQAGTFTVTFRVYDALTSGTLLYS